MALAGLTLDIVSLSSRENAMEAIQSRSLSRKKVLTANINLK